MATEWSSSMLVHASEEGRASRVFDKKRSSLHGCVARAAADETRCTVFVEWSNFTNSQPDVFAGCGHEE